MQSSDDHFVHPGVLFQICHAILQNGDPLILFFIKKSQNFHLFNQVQDVLLLESDGRGFSRKKIQRFPYLLKILQSIDELTFLPTYNYNPNTVQHIKSVLMFCVFIITLNQKVDK
ncbi:hypothetical protein AMECASPLE_029057 [Ameca splendens]|uniref:Uncharacterized protein n=1 Tax=Ameca splendens TaxID=208324 RepID=A0ABV0XIQ8_9TELE